MKESPPCHPHLLDDRVRARPDGSGGPQKGASQNGVFILYPCRYMFCPTLIANTRSLKNLGFWLAIVLALALVGCSSSTEEPRLSSAKDYYSSLEKFQRPTDCRRHIRESTCLVENNEESNPRPNNSKPRTCLPGGERYHERLEQVYDEFPPLLQDMFCSLRHIYIEKSFFGSAYAEIVWRPTEDNRWTTDGAFMGIRQSLFDEDLNLEEWAAWKEQLSFGGKPNSYVSDPSLPLVKTEGKDPFDLLYFLIAHEFGHFFDEVNALNRYENCREEKDVWTCDLLAGSYASLSWADSRTPLRKINHREKLCFYRCEGKKFDPQNIGQIYSDLWESDFISLYATVNPGEDFAEFFAFYMMDEYRFDYNYIVELPDQSIFDPIEKLDSPVFRKKVEYIQNFLSRDRIYYP